MIPTDEIKLLLQSARKGVLSRTHPARVFPGIDDDLLADFSRETGFPCPADLRDWLKITNGFDWGACLFGYRTSQPELDMTTFIKLETEVDLIRRFRQNAWIPIGNDGCGNYYVLAPGGGPGGGPALFVDAISEATYVTASDLAHFLVFFLKKELRLDGGSWPFTEAYVVKNDQDIVNHHSLGLPWHTA